MRKINDGIVVSISDIMAALDKTGIATIVTNLDKCIINMNITAENFTGLKLEEYLGRHLNEIESLNMENSQTVLIMKNDAGFPESTRTALNVYPENNEYYYITMLNAKNCSSVRNDLMAVSENNLRTIFDSTYDAIIVHDLQGNILDVNKKMIEMYKITGMKVTELGIVDLSSEDNPFDRLPEIWEKVMTGETMLFEWNAKRPGDNSVFEVEVYLVRISLHHQDAILATIRDISEKKKAERMIQYLSFHDKLTGLYNRAFFEKELMRLDTERELPISIIMADVNGLKLANDAFGHLAGDDLLKTAAEVLRRACRREDIIARWGGDEFVVILTKTDELTASKICDRVREECIESIPSPIFLSIGLGYATKKHELQSVFGVIQEAEAHMYKNKLKEGKENRRRIISSLLTRSREWDHDIDSMMKLCYNLAESCGLDETRLDQIRLLAYIHDIGKVSIPAEIINKVEPLTSEEWEVIKKHSEIGFRIASTYPEYVHLAESILSHHEHFDGTGYPRKLKGEEIPLMARILSVVDAYDAMTSNRPYRRALSHEEALKEIEERAGSQFDPLIAKTFVKLNK